MVFEKIIPIKIDWVNKKGTRINIIPISHTTVSCRFVIILLDCLIFAFIAIAITYLKCKQLFQVNPIVSILKIKSMELIY